ncbi:MAG: ATP-dependent helicase HrpB [Pseudomonadota bacterium]
MAGRTFAPLPIDAVLPDLLAALSAGNAAVLAAPPGAGKTTRVPPALAAAAWATGKIVMLEPRRVAARAAAERIAAEAGSQIGAYAGYRIRGDSRVSAKTRIEVVTEGVLTRMLQSDPALEGVSAILFDEIHERSIHADLGLALAREVQEALRPDLRLLAMSATLETGRFATLLGGAPMIEATGRQHRVETVWRERPGEAGRERLDDGVATLIERALNETDEGDVLAFLPGAAEIAATAARLQPRLPGVVVVPLHGSLPFAKQRAALAADAAGRRRVVLATAIAETSLTVEGVHVVVDGGRARRAETDPATGLTRLVTVPVSRAEAEQRRGRAGRLGPGRCYRNWAKAEEGALPAFAPPEILTADLAPLALELAAWGVADPSALAFADPPPAGALAEARALLTMLGALETGDGASTAITAHGRAMAAFPAHPRLAHMVLRARDEGRAEAALACRLAALLQSRDPLGAAAGAAGAIAGATAGAIAGADIARRLDGLARPERAARESADRSALEAIRAEADRLSRAAGLSEAGARRAEPAPSSAAGGLLSLAYPDRVALRREGTEPRYLMANGRGATVAPGDPLGALRLLVVWDAADGGREARVRGAAALDEASLRDRHGSAIAWHKEAVWSRREGRVVAEEQERFAALVLSRRRWRDAPYEALGKALCTGIRERGVDRLAWGPAAMSLRARIAWLRDGDGDGDGHASDLALSLPDLSDMALARTLDDWLLPFLSGERRPGEVPADRLDAALRHLVGEASLVAVERAAPAFLATPLGGRVAIDYSRDEPTVAIRVQELFGLDRHPTVGDPSVPLVLELTSPAGRPVQVTRDLPGFWRNSYAEVRKEMRARYPKHSWPEDPIAAAPTTRAKRRPR